MSGGWFERELDRQAVERVLDLGRFDDVFRSSADGYLPVWRAAEELNMSEAEVIFLARTGKLAARAVGGVLHVQPAIVSVLGVEAGGRDVRSQSPFPPGGS